MKKNANNVPIPRQISLLVDAIGCDSPEAAKLLVKKAVSPSFEDKKSEFNPFSQVEIADEELDAVVSLIKGIQPKDSVEAILAAQFVALHLQGMGTLAKNDPESKSHGMMMIRLSHQAIETLQKYRNKGSNINVNYFVKNEGQAIIQTNIGKKNPKKKDYSPWVTNTYRSAELMREAQAVLVNIVLWLMEDVIITVCLLLSKVDAIQNRQ